MTRHWVLVAAMLLAGCVNLEAPAPSQTTRLVVHGVLDPQAGDQTVLVYRARTGLPKAVEAHGVSDDEPVADAQVWLTTPDGATWSAGRFLDEAGDCCLSGIYVFPQASVGAAVRAGGTFTLRIRTTEGEEVTGMTTMPGPAMLSIKTSPVFFRQRDTLRLNWPRVPGAASYEVVIGMRFGEYRTFADTSFEMAGTALTIAGDEIFSLGNDAPVVVSAVDANYYDYYRSQSDPFAGAAPSHLSGAVGVFGSIVPIYATQLRIR